MSLINFKDWLQADESSPNSRAKFAMVMGTGPDIALPSLNSGATLNPLLFHVLLKKGVVKDDGSSEKSEKELDKKFDDHEDKPKKKSKKK